MLHLFDFAFNEKKVKNALHIPALLPAGMSQRVWGASAVKKKNGAHPTHTYTHTHFLGLTSLKVMLGIVLCCSCSVGARWREGTFIKCK